MFQSAQTAYIVHILFEAAAIAIGFRFYLKLRRQEGGRDPVMTGEGFSLLVGCLLGAGIGNKAAFWLDMPHLFDMAAGWRLLLQGGQSIIGGLLGGLIGVEIAKKITGQGKSTGDLFVMPLLLGIAFGRIGCFLAGLHDGTYGIETALPWGVDFGDGVRRHPTQIYDMLFCGVMAWALYRWRTLLMHEAGLSFKIMLWFYLLWRLLIDFLKPVPWAYPGGLSGLQWLCIVALLCYTPLLVRQLRSLFNDAKKPPMAVL